MESLIIAHYYVLACGLQLLNLTAEKKNLTERDIRRL